MRRLNFQPAVAHPPDAVEQAARRRPRGTLAVGVIDAAMTGAHEQARLREPRDRAAQVGAIDGEDQELVLPLLVLALDCGRRRRCAPSCRPRAAGADCRTSPAAFRSRRKSSTVPRVTQSSRPSFGSEEIADDGDAATTAEAMAAQTVGQPAEERPRARGVAAGPAMAVDGSIARSPSDRLPVMVVTSGSPARPDRPVSSREQGDQVVDLGRSQRLEIVRPAVVAGEVGHPRSGRPVIA